MKQIIGFILTVSLAAAASADSLPRERQREIIENYLYVTGQSERLPEGMAAGATDDEGHPIIKCGMSAVADFVMNRHLFDRDLLAPLAAQLGPRPALEAEQVLVSPVGLFKIHYTVQGPDSVNIRDLSGNGVPDYVDTVAIIFDSVHAAMVDGLNYPKPPIDDFYPSGGDSLYDVYLLDLGVGVYGLSYLDSLFIDGPGSLRATSFMELDRNYDGLPQYANRPLDAVRVTAAHEYFHAVQFGIDFTESDVYGTGPNAISARYWMEMSAVWMEEQLYDNINDYYNYLPYFFNDPRMSLQQFNSYSDLRPYANGIFPIFLAEAYGPNIIHSIWDRCRDGGFGADFLFVANEAIDSATGSTGDWVTAFREFTLWNWFTGSRAGLAPAGVGYSERAEYPGFPDTMIAVWNVYPVVVRADENELNPLHNGATYISFNDLFRIETDTTYWFCDTYLDSICLDSIEIADPSGGYDFFHIGCGTNDTTWWVCSNPSDTVCSKKTRVSASADWDFYIITCDTTVVGTDTTYQTTTAYYQCNEWVDGMCVDSTQTDGVGGYDWMYIDSLFDLTVALGTNPNIPPLVQPWGVSFIYRFAANHDSVAIDRMVIPDPAVVQLAVPNPADYYRITIALSPATYSNSSDYYRPYPFYQWMDVGYFAEAEVNNEEYANKPSAVLAPYPNPAIVAQMFGDPIRFRMQAATDSLGQSRYADPYLVVDIFTVAGELVRTVEGPEGDIVLGLGQVSWDMRNQNGKEVASGAYIAYGRLYDSAAKKQLLAEDHVKVAVIR